MGRGQISGQPRRKLYTLAAVLIADDLVRQVNEIDAAEWYLLHRIGYPVGQPQIIEMRDRPAASASPVDLRPISKKSRSQILERLDRFADDLLDARLSFDRRMLRTLADTPVRSG